jgi:OFA family oxalate/formate antiporter-like MFS transporter
VKYKINIEKGISMIIKNTTTANRWIILFGGFLLSLMGGMSYAWGSFVMPLVNDWGWTVTEATLPFTIMIIVFALTMIPAGWLQDKIGPRKIAVWGSVLFFVGYALSSMLRWIPNPAWLVLVYGLIVGTACGLTYSCIAPAARKWYPDHPGFAVSTSVMGFGLAAVVFSPLKRSMIDLWVLTEL